MNNQRRAYDTQSTWIFNFWFVALMMGVSHFATAEETAGEKVEAAAGDAKVSTKKAARKVRKKVRDATGNGSVVKDAKDSVNNAGDDVSNEAKKAKNKVD